jgi:hypothetical protein
MRRKLTDRRKYRCNEKEELEEWWKQVTWMRRLYWQDYADEKCKEWALREYEKKHHGGEK